MKDLRKRIRRGGVFVMLCLLTFSGIPVYAGEHNQEILLLHHHSENCMGNVTVEKEADGDSILETIGESVCSQCGGVVHEYRFRAVCSCGERWESRGHACVHSAYGSEPAGCPVCSPVDFNTLHEHVERRRICGKEETDVMGRINLTVSETEPAREVILKAEYEGTLQTPDFLWEKSVSKTEDAKNDQVQPVKTSSISVTDNGVYKLISTYDEDGIHYSVSREIVITNIDREGPVFSGISYDKDPTNQPVELKITAEDGSGLAELPYSLDGEKYQKENIFTIAKNGTYTVYVADRLGNVSKSSIEVSNLDFSPPQIQFEATPEIWEEGECVVSVQAKDKGLGLAKNAYSFDGGKTWGNNTSVTLKKSGTVTVWVRDLAGNISKASHKAVLDDTRIKEEQRRREIEEAEKKAEQERIEREKAEQERIEREKAEQERIEREKAEQERIAKEKAEQERIEREKAEQERIVKEKAEQERIEREKAEQERIEREKAEQERIEKERAERERIEKEKAEKERIEKERAERERIEKEKVEKERIEKERAERERIEKEKEEQERIEKERAERERIEKEKEEQERIEKEKAERERIERERAEREMLNGEMPKKEKNKGGSAWNVVKQKLADFFGSFSSLKELFLKMPEEIRIITVSAGTLTGGLFVGFGFIVLTKTAGVFWLDDAGKAHFMGRSYIRRTGERFEIRLGTKDLRKAERPELVIRMPGLFFGLHRYKPLTVFYGENMISQHVEKRVRMTLR